MSTSAGYSNNPFAETNGDSASTYVAADIVPQLTLQTNRSTFTINGDAHVVQYLSHYPTTDSYRVGLGYRGRPSAHLTTFLRLDLASEVLGSDDNVGLGGTLGTGLATGTTTGTATGSAGDAASTTGAASSANQVSPSVVSGPLVSDIGLLGSRDRRRSLYATGGLSAAVTARDNLSVSAFADLARYRRFGDVSNYDGYGGTLGYSRQVSARFQLGLQGSASRYDYRGPQGDTDVYSIQATGSGRVNKYWLVDGALGVSFTDRTTGGSDHRTSLSGNLNMCRQGERGTFCAAVSRQARATGLNGAQFVTSAGVDYDYRLSQRARLSLDATYVQEGGLSSLNGVEDKYLRLSATYDRQIFQRLHGTVSARYRDIFGGGPGRASDYGGQLGLSYHFGDLR